MVVGRIGNQVYEKLLLSLTEECVVPAYIVHDSADADDYSIYFQVREITENLRKGVFVRPKIELWSGRSDLNRARLSKNLRHEFVRQLEKDKQERLQKFNDERQALAGSGEPVKTSLAAKISWLGSAVAATLLVANPIADVIILFIAVTSGKAALMDMIKMLKLGVSSWSAEKTDAAKESELEEMVDSKTNAIDQALENIEIRLHPLMYKAAHDHYGLAATSARGLVTDADPLPEFIETMVQDA